MAILLAPMEGVVDPVIRDLLTQVGGYDICTTEFVRVTHQVLPAKVYLRYAPELQLASRTRKGTIVLTQLLGSDIPKLIENAKQAISLGAPGIDLNFGCPAKTVNRHEGGAKLLERPEHVGQIITDLKAALPVPVSAKIRLGYKDKTLFNEIIASVNEARPSWLTIHARTKQEAYLPPAHWEYISKAKEQITTFPVIANGDIWTLEDAKRCYEVTGCSDFMLGRGAIANPFLGREIKSSNWYQKAKSAHTLTVDQIFPEWIEKETSQWAQPNSWPQTKRLLNLMRLHPHYQKREETILPKLKQWTRQLQRHSKEAEITFHAIKRKKSLAELDSSWTL